MLGTDATKLGVRDKTTLTLSAVLIDIQAERTRHDELRDAGRFTHTCADPGIAEGLPSELLDHCVRSTVLAEEIGEVSHELNEWVSWEHKTKRGMLDAVLINGERMTEEVKEAYLRDRRADMRARVRKELIQAAAVIQAWIEGLDMEVMG